MTRTWKQEEDVGVIRHQNTSHASAVEQGSAFPPWENRRYLRPPRDLDLPAPVVLNCISIVANLGVTP